MTAPWCCLLRSAVQRGYAAQRQLGKSQMEHSPKTQRLRIQQKNNCLLPPHLPQAKAKIFLLPVIKLSFGHFLLLLCTSFPLKPGDTAWGGRSTSMATSAWRQSPNTTGLGSNPHRDSPQNTMGIVLNHHGSCIPNSMGLVPQNTMVPNQHGSGLVPEARSYSLQSTRLQLLRWAMDMQAHHAGPNSSKPHSEPLALIGIE